MYCKNCGSQMDPNQAICVKCGFKKGEGNKFCQNCGKEVTPNASVCLSCGYAITNNGGDLAGQDKMTVGLVALFLGGLGIHNFMMGETKKGIVKIVADILCGLGVLLGLIDAIRIFSGSYKVDKDALF